MQVSGWRCLSVLFVGFAVFLLCVSGCSTNKDDGSQETAENGLPEYSYPTCDVDEQEVERIIGQMTLEEKVAQMYFVGVTLLFWELAETQSLVMDMGVGGVFLRPITGIALSSPEVTAQNTNILQDMAMSRSIPVPLFIAADQEGGIPQALSRITGGTDQPGNLGLGATFDPESTHLSYGIMGEQLSAVGINITFAPVVGLMLSHEESSMYTRCFGERSPEVTRHAAQAVRGLQQNLVIATAKHFPSHSTAPGDEHFILPVSDDDEQTIRDLYLPPFASAIRAGADMFMTTHAAFTALDGSLPSTYSYRVFTELLREEMGFEGLIVTDDMNMGSITLTEVDEHPDVLAIKAGADLILDAGANEEPPYGVAPGNQGYAYDVEGQIRAVLDAVADGRISEERINQSVRRILRTKMKYCLFSEPFVDPGEVSEKVNTPAQIEASRDLHGKAVTLIRNEQGIWPLDPSGEFHIHVVCAQALLSQMYPGAAWPTVAGTDLLKEIRRAKPTASVSGKTFDVDPNPFQVAYLVDKARSSNADFLIIGTYNALYYEGQKALVRQLVALNVPTILVVVGMPYDLMAFPEVSTCLVTYSNRDLALETVAKVLFGKMDPQGRLPVSLPGLYDVGWSADR